MIIHRIASNLQSVILLCILAQLHDAIEKDSFDSNAKEQSTTQDVALVQVQRDDAKTSWHYLLLLRKAVA